LRNGEFQAEAWLERLPGDDAQRRKLLPRLLLAASPHHAPDPTLDTRAMVSALVLDPVYQLK
jgi:hypothetical protein